MQQHRNEPIAVIGSACRFAGDANSPSKFAKVLRNPPDLRREIPEDRFSSKGFYHRDGSYHGHTNVRHAYFLDDNIAAFDAEFFGTKPVEAKAMDPQQRMLLEVAYEGIESAGYSIDGLRGSDTAVYVGCMVSDYSTLLLRDLQTAPTYYATGTGASILSNRLSYFYDWHGPSITLDTACSSSLVGVHMAAQALRAAETRTALVCGANLILGPENFIIESKLKMLSPDGQSRMWDQDANGYARAEGVAAIVLKTLSAAIEDGDHIECIIRETGVNQDGASSGITMPSASAQEALIKRTYAQAGLDLLVANDRPQYFEAHGTGTPAGDPIEAEAIYNSLNSFTPSPTQQLYVGSVKTVIGHTEGTAGLASIIKVSQAMQHSFLPPNLHFDHLSDRVAPYYKNVEILKSSRTWQPGPDGKKRASVNSFGFGGANAHAIVESHGSSKSSAVTVAKDSTGLFTPYVFSATSEHSLRSNLAAYLESSVLQEDSLDTRDLAWTLHARRSTFMRRVAFPASSIADLQNAIRKTLSQEDSDVSVRAVPLPKGENRKFLGVFTGQGAQYPRMAAELIEKSHLAEDIIDELDSSLKQLPDGPSFSLKACLLADPTTSIIHEAAISQPLCTAVQILLVRILALAGIRFDAVVGHSSGEIAAAYAAGYLTASDAIRIAYYRGLHLRLASSPNGDRKGAMLAVGSSKEDMDELCADDEFKGRICVAASNSASSVTISGDADAIAELQDILTDEGKFNRLLKVDRAYHSSHMRPCREAYLESLQKCGITIQEPNYPCLWYSSVYNRPVDSNTKIEGEYWIDNMAQPVLFAEALAGTLASDKFHLALEVGPHPALKGPATQNISEITEKGIPYHGLLSRGSDAVSAFTEGLGFVWTHVEKSFVNMEGFERAMTRNKHQYTVINNLPSYRWNHKHEYWHESRVSRKLRMRERAVHPLLGDLTPDSAPHNMVWKNLLRVSELPWLMGHKVQSQVVYPAAGYLTSAIEASRIVAGDTGNTTRLIELRSFVIHQAVFFDDDDAGIEVLVSMAEISRTKDRISAKFTYSAALGSNAKDFSLAASGEVVIALGESSQDLLPARKPSMTHAIDVEADKFYTALADLGYEFADRFKSFSGLRRKLNNATCFTTMRSVDPGEEALLIHPAELDAALQSVILAYSYPYDDQLRSLHLPTGMQCIRVNPALLGTAIDRSKEVEFPLDSAIAPKKANQRGIVGNIEMYSNVSDHAAIQIQGASYMPLSGDDSEEDRRVFSRVHWVNTQPDGAEAAKDVPMTEDHVAMVCLLERIATFYLRQFDTTIPADDPLRSEFPWNYYLNYAHYVTEMVDSGKHKWAQREWLQDTAESIQELSKPLAHTPDVEIMHLTGQQMPRVFRGETTILEQFRSNDVLDRYYASGFGLQESGKWVSRTVKQLVDRFPHMNILEVGAGTGGATKAIFREIGTRFDSYTYTDISAAFFENAASIFSQQKDQMVFKTFNAENDPVGQGFEAGKYDLIVAFFVIHAVSDLDKALGHIRTLLKPGGSLVVGEGQEGENGVASSGFIFGTLPGWWFGGETGRVLSPHVSPQEWDRLLRKNGFSGVESHVPDDFVDVLNVYHFSSRAVDDQISFYNAPLSADAGIPPAMEDVMIIGGATPRSSHLVDGLKKQLPGKFALNVHVTPTLETLDFSIVPDRATIVSFVDLDSPVFKEITPERFEALKKAFETDRSILWVTSGRLDDEPYANMITGFGRTAIHETPGLRLQHLDIARPEQTTPETVAEILLRFHAAESMDTSALMQPEPEIIIDADQKQFVPRLRPIPELNDRYNSGRRNVTRDVSATDLSFSIQPTMNGCTVNALSKWQPTQATEDMIQLQTAHSTWLPFNTALGHKLLVLGVEAKTGISYLALVPALKSVLMVPKSSIVAIDLQDRPADTILNTIASSLIVTSILSGLRETDVAIAHNAPHSVARAFESHATSKGINVVFVADSTRDDAPTTWIKLPKYTGQQDLDEILRHEPKVFAGFSNHGTEEYENEDLILSKLPVHCRKNILKTIYSAWGSESHSKGSESAEILREALGYAMLQQRDTLAGHSVSLGSLASGEMQTKDPMTIIDWTSVTSLPVQISRLDSAPMFKGTGSTYWIVGMTGALGISLADWMIKAGAKNVVLTSRNPQVEPEWVAEHKKRGATVAVIACDVTSETSLRNAHKTIVDTMPPIAGVMNGAMVLRDTAIRNMSYQELTDVMKPKVNGSIYLDRIFYEVDLDFFVLVSSINCVVGNLGQANYAAANTFMCALAAQRRKRGFRANTMNGGAIIGAGYMERESRRALDIIVAKLNMMRLSEEDWCQSLCEAIDASRLESSVGAELTTGLSDVPFDIPNAPYWFTNPKFADFIVRAKVHGGPAATTTGTASVQERLLSCTSEEEVYNVISNALANQLRGVLQTDVSDEDLMASNGSQIGLDSLVSVDIRSWFLNQLQVNIPVLKIMSNDAIARLVEFAVENLSSDMWQSGGSTTDDSASDGDSTRNSKKNSIFSPESRTSPMTTNTVPSLAPSRDQSALPEGRKKINEGIDWDSEAQLPADLASISIDSSNPPSQPPKVVILTGASGLLGHNLLSYLLEHTSIRKVVCLAVRKLSQRLSKEELPRSPRVEYHEGDLSDTNLGLSSETARELFSQVDAVIHNGSDTSHLKFFPDMRSSNVGSTLALIRLCMPRRIPIHYVSSVGVATLYSESAFPPVALTSENSRPPAVDGSFGYMSTKYVNERLLEAAHKAYGLPVAIHRPSTIIRKGDDATTSKAELDWVNALLHYAKKIALAPRVQHNHGALDLVSVERCCGDIVGTIQDGSDRAKKEVTYVHNVGDVVIGLDHIQDLGVEQQGRPFEVVPLKTWLEKAVAAGLHPAVGTLIEMMDVPGGPDYPKLLRE